MKYFVEALTAEATDRINNFLLSLSCTPEWSSNQEDTSGQLHDVCEVYSLRNAKRIQSVTHDDSRVRVRHWKREDTGGARLESAKFLVIVAPAIKIRRTAKFKKAVEQIPKPATA